MKALPAFALLLLISCGEDEPAEPTYEELLEGQEIHWGVVNGVTRPSEMMRLYCELPSLGGVYACYSLDNACGAGDGPTICYDPQAKMVGCIKGKYPIDEPLYYRLDKTAGGRQRVNMSGSVSDPGRIPCKD